MIPEVALAAALAVSGPVAVSAAAVSATDVVQGQYLRLESVADWAAASSMVAGDSVRWDVSVSADAPDPGTVSIGVRAKGDAELRVDAARCPQRWETSGCPGGAAVVRSGWSMPLDGVEVPLLEVPATEAAHIRFTISLADPSAGGSTAVSVHATVAGETVVAGSEGRLAVTGLSSIPWVLAGGAVLLLAGGAFAAVRRRRPRGEGVWR